MATVPTAAAWGDADVGAAVSTGTAISDEYGTTAGPAGTADAARPELLVPTVATCTARAAVADESGSSAHAASAADDPYGTLIANRELPLECRAACPAGTAGADHEPACSACS